MATATAERPETQTAPEKDKQQLQHEEDYSEGDEDYDSYDDNYAHSGDEDYDSQDDYSDDDIPQSRRRMRTQEMQLQRQNADDDYDDDSDEEEDESKAMEPFQRNAQGQLEGEITKSNNRPMEKMQMASQQKSIDDEDGLKLKLEINLDVEVELKARIHGDLTLALLA